MVGVIDAEFLSLFKRVSVMIGNIVILILGD